MPDPAKPVGAPRHVPEPRQKKSANFWIFIIVGVVSVAILGTVAFLVLPGEKEVDTAFRDAEWKTVTVEEGWFTVDYPGELEFRKSDLEGTRGKQFLSKVEIGTAVVECAYYDLGKGDARKFPFSASDGVLGLAEQTTDGAPSIDPRPVGGFDGSVAKFKLTNGNRSHAWVVRRGNRVYLLAVQNIAPEHEQIAMDYFDSFKLEPVVYDAVNEWLPSEPVIADKTLEDGGVITFRYRQSKVSPVEFIEGTPPYKVEVTSAEMPVGLKAEGSNDRLWIGGVPRETGDFQVAYRMTDAAGFSIEGTVNLKVVPHPFYITCSGIDDVTRELKVKTDYELDLEFQMNGEEPAGPVKWAITGKPPGTKFKPENGGFRLYGKLPAPGEYNVRVSTEARKEEDGERLESTYDFTIYVEWVER